MADTSDTSKIDSEPKDSRNNSDEIQDQKTLSDASEAEKTTDTNTSGPTVFGKNNDSVKSTPHDESEKAVNTNISSASTNQGETTVSKTSPDRHVSDGIDHVNASSDGNQSQQETEVDASFDNTPTGGLVESKPTINLDEVKTASCHNELEETKKTNTSFNSNEVTRTNDSASSHDGNEQRRRKNENSSTDQHDLKKIHTSNIISDVDESDRSSDSSISYRRGEADLLDSLFTNATNKNLINRLLGCVYGQALGDAYGLSTEFENRHDVAYNYPDRSKLIPFPDYVLTGHSRRWKRGDWTDDTDQWILILETLMDYNGDEKVFARKLTDWIRYGYPELGDHGGMGLGANVSQVVRSDNYIGNPLKASEAVWERSHRQAAPNGAVMRCSASAFVHFNDLEKVKSTTILMCKTTHFDPRCIASCLAVCLAISYLLRETVYDNDIESLIELVQKETMEILGDSFTEEDRQTFLWHTDKARTLEELNLDEPSSIGYTYKCLASGFYGLRSTRPFKETLNDLIRYGGDADTNGAVCGTMYGARHGYEALPYEWLREMPNKKWLDKKIIKYLEKISLNETEAMETNQ